MTVTANVHIGTSAWATGAVTAGAGRSNSGQVYRAVNSGTSAAPGPTHTSGTVTDGGGVQWKWLSAFDYSTFATWYASIPATLADAYVGLFWNHGEVLGSTAFTDIFSFTAKTTTSTFTITAQTAPGESAADAASPRLYYDPTKGMALRATANYVYGMNSACDNVIVRGFQIKADGNYSTIRANNNPASNIFDRCIFVNNSTTVEAAISASLRNCLFVHNSTVSNSRAVFLIFGGSAINCTIVRPSNLTAAGSAFRLDYGTSVIRNCAVFGFTTAPALSSASAAADGHNGSDLSTPVPGSTGNVSGIAYTTATFVQPSAANTATVDYRLASGSALIGIGVTDTTNIPTGADFYGTARGSTWSAGAFQFAGAAPTVRKPLMFVA